MRQMVWLIPSRETEFLLWAGLISCSLFRFSKIAEMIPITSRINADFGFSAYPSLFLGRLKIQTHFFVWRGLFLRINDGQVKLSNLYWNIGGHISDLKKNIYILYYTLFFLVTWKGFLKPFSNLPWIFIYIWYHQLRLYRGDKFHQDQLRKGRPNKRTAMSVEKTTVNELPPINRIHVYLPHTRFCLKTKKIHFSSHLTTISSHQSPVGHVAG